MAMCFMRNEAGASNQNTGKRGLIQTNRRWRIADFGLTKSRAQARRSFLFLLCCHSEERSDDGLESRVADPGMDIARKSNLRSEILTTAALAMTRRTTPPVQRKATHRSGRACRHVRAEEPQNL